MPQFDISTFSSQLFWLVICWGILFIYLWKFLVPRMTAKLSDREHKIKSILADAANFESQAESMLLKYEDDLNNFKQTQKERLQQVSAFIQKNKEDLEFDLKKELNEAVEKLEVTLKESQKKLFEDVPENFEAVVAEFAKRQLPLKLDNESSIQDMLKLEIKKLDHHD